MLVLVLTLCVIGVVFAIRNAKKHKRCSQIIFIVCLIIGLFTWSFMASIFGIVNQDDEGYYQKQIDTLTEVNKQMEKWIETIEIELSNDPQLLNYVEEYLNKEISSNEKEISKCSILQEKSDLYRWLIYFK